MSTMSIASVCAQQKHTRVCYVTTKARLVIKHIKGRNRLQFGMVVQDMNGKEVEGRFLGVKHDKFNVPAGEEEAAG